LKIYLFAVIVVLIGTSLAYIHFGSERYLTNVEADAPFDFPIPTDAETRERGRHIARTRGCFGCHGQQLEGAVFSEEWDWVATAVAPNLARFAKEHSPAVLEAAIRQGIGAEGRALWSMPSYNFANLRTLPGQPVDEGAAWRKLR
jgi:hypothetical protein